MLPTILGFGIVIGVVIAGMYAAMRWGMSLVTRDLVARLHAGESIVNDERVPESWVAPYRRRIAALRNAGGSPDTIDGVGRRAREHCLKQLDDLIRFYEKAGVVDSNETREILIEALQKQRERWRTLDWRVLLEPDGAGQA